VSTTTELILAFRFKSDIPQNVIETLQFMMAKYSEEPFSTPDHAFFVDQRHPSWADTYQPASDWKLFFWHGTGGYSGKAHAFLDWNEFSNQYALTIRTYLRNGDTLVHRFLDWLAPYVDNSQGFLGYTRDQIEPDHIELIYLEHGDIYYYSAQLWKNPPDMKKTRITNYRGSQNT
jgi:hypothetical protein